jgi:glycine oxidase
MARTDVIVLGGGIIGCAVAEELARRGRRVLLLERERLGIEASSAAAGILSAQMDLPEPGPMLDLCLEARKLYPAWVRRIEQASGLSVGYHRDGILYLALRRSEARAMAARIRWQRARGLRAEEWSAAQVRRQEPSVDRPVLAGFCFPDEGQVDNVLLMRALGAACRKAGVEVREQTTVYRIRLRGHAIRDVRTSRGSFRAPVVINCLGSWAGLDEAFPVRLPVAPVRGQMLAFQGPKRLFRRAVMSERAYVVQRRDGQLLIGSTVEFAGYDKSLTLEGMHHILSGLCRITSALKRCTFVDAWAGLRPCSADQRPILGPTSVEGLYVATAHFRHGILFAPITAQVMAELILCGCASLDLSAFFPQRFAKGPPARGPADRALT